jgi:2-polyprenyl-3-methyl-5-hydroxy-6-metoxy-1,4-benzoquinol methylase
LVHADLSVPESLTMPVADVSRPPLLEYVNRLQGTDPRCHGKRVGVLIVAYNAVTTLVPVLRRIPAAVLENIAEIAVFDDTSKDDTYIVAHGYKAVQNVEKLSIHRNERNLGYGGNQKRGFAYFAAKGFDAVVLLHGDGQYAPECMASLYAPLVAGEADAVFGSRLMKDYGGPLKGGMPLYKYLGNRVLSYVENAALGMNLTEFHSGYRAYSLNALRRIKLDALSDDFHFDTEIIVKLNHQRFRIVEVPIPTYYGNEICHVNGVHYAYNVLRAVRRYRRTVSGAARYPEFAEYGARYSLKASKGSSHDYFQRLIGSGLDVLDVGCGDGTVAGALAAQGNRIIGVDTLEAPTSGRHLTEYFRADLERGWIDVDEHLASRHFDVILFGDVLEHLADPGKLLAGCRQYLKPNGRVLVSVPNVANIYVRLSLLAGRFNYAERGILDRTHLRFFTRKTARRFAEEAGFTVTHLHMTVIPFELLLGASPDHWLCRLGNRALRLVTRLWQGLFGYQIVMALQPRAKAAHD